MVLYDFDQVRTSEALDSTGKKIAATVFSAFTVRAGPTGTVFQVELSADRSCKNYTCYNNNII